MPSLRGFSSTASRPRPPIAALGCAALILGATPLSAALPNGRLEARPEPQIATTAPRGEAIPLAGGALAYVPPILQRERPPLIVVLHGAGGNARSMIDMLQRSADHLGVVLLAAQSSGPDWDAIDHFFDGYEGSGGTRVRVRNFTARFGPDLAHLDEALSDLFRRIAIDEDDIGLLGYSQGASYALVVGRANPDLFASIAAIAPGLLLTTGNADPSQPIFIAHGRDDRTTDIELSETLFVPRLRASGHPVTFFAYEGGHGLNAEVMIETLGFVMRSFEE